MQFHIRPLLLAVGLLLLPVLAIADTPSVVLIIDDLGNSRDTSLRAVGLHGRVTCAVLPHTPYASFVANHAQQAGKEVIVHMPMSSIHGRKTGPGGLNEQQSIQHFVQTLTSNLHAIPHARGLNNHMGSALTQNDELMSLMMSVVSEHPLYFVDSRTSANTVAASMAGLHNIKHLSRDVFLDNSQAPEDIHRQFQQLLMLARKQGLAVGIGHPYPSTLDYLESVLPALERDENVRLIHGSEAIALRYPIPPPHLAMKGEHSFK